MTVFLLQQQSRMVEIQIIWPANPNVYYLALCKKKKKFANPSFTKKSIFYYLNSSKYLPRWISSRYLMTTFSYDHFKRVNYKPQYYVWLFSYQFQSHPGCFLLSRGIKVSLHKTCVLILDLEKKKEYPHWKQIIERALYVLWWKK